MTLPAGDHVTKPKIRNPSRKILHNIMNLIDFHRTYLATKMPFSQIHPKNDVQTMGWNIVRYSLYLALLIGQVPSICSIPLLLLPNMATFCASGVRVLVRRALFRIQREHE